MCVCVTVCVCLKKYEEQKILKESRRKVGSKEESEVAGFVIFSK